MNRLRLVAVSLVFLASACTGAMKEEAKPAAPKAAERPAQPAPPTGSTIEKETLDACVKRNPDNEAYCRCYANELGKRYDEKVKAGEVSVQERGQIAVQSALACKQLSKKTGD